MSVIIILGNSNVEILNKRLDKAIKENEKLTLYEDYNSILNYIIVSGGGNGVKNGEKKYESEAEYMSEYVSERVSNPTKRIVSENLSNSTVENIINSFEFIKIMFPTRFYGSNVNVTICTSSFHLKRTIIIANLLNKEGYTLKFIHTDEIVNETENELELKHIDNFMNYYCAKHVAM